MRRLLAVVALLALLCAPAAARAATVSVEGGALRFAAEPGEENFPTFHHRAENEYVVYDPRFPGRPVVAGAGCVQDGDNTVVCPGAGVTRAELALGDLPARRCEQASDSRCDPPIRDLLTLTAAIPVPVSVTAAEGARARVTYLDERPVQVLLDGLANDGPAGRGDNIGPGVDHVTTGEGTDTIGGNDRANDLYGSWGDDDIAGAGGDDTITLASFNDVGADAVGLESHGADAATCGAGDDTVYYNATDTVAGDCERRVRVTESGFQYRGTSGRDRIIARRGPAEVRGGAGGDRLGASRDAGGVILRGEAGDDRLAGNVYEDRLDGGSGNDSLAGSEGSDLITGGRGRDGISGGAGADTVFARDGFTDTIRCGSGRDTVTADRRDRVARDCERVRR
jgi:hypothetical protein